MKLETKKAEADGCFGFWDENLATTYSRGTYRTTTIGNAVFDGRVRDGIGSGHSFMVTKKFVLDCEGTSFAGCVVPGRRVFVEYYTQGWEAWAFFSIRLVLKSLDFSVAPECREKRKRSSLTTD